jgi:hypothetical protein
LKCPGYLQWKEENKIPAAQEVQPTLDKYKSSMDTDKIERINRKIAHAIYVTGRPFTLFKDPAWRAVFKEFNYTPLSADQISGFLLEKEYNDMEKQIVHKLRSSDNLTLVTNESTNVCINRMINYSVVTSNGDLFYYKTKEAPIGALTAQKLAEGIVDTTTEITNRDTKRIRAVATDTCPQMLATHNILYTIPATAHMFTILCNLHSRGFLQPGQTKLTNPPKCISLIPNKVVDKISIAHHPK